MSQLSLKSITAFITLPTHSIFEASTWSVIATALWLSTCARLAISDGKSSPSLNILCVWRSILFLIWNPPFPLVDYLWLPFILNIVIKMKCSVFAPSHITGFFEIINHQDPLKRGSRGAGVAMDKGVVTNLQIIDNNLSDNMGVNVKINGEEDAKNASITFKTLEVMDREFGVGSLIGDSKVRIDHELEVPIGAGFGTSAACALGTALTLSKILELDITFNKAASMAHIAEIEMESGLGDVVAEVNGGITLRLKEGAPGVALTDKMILNCPEKDLYVICKSLGGIETSEIIGNPNHKRRINSTGRDMLNILLKHPNPETFLKLSKRFAMETGLLSNEVHDIINILEDETIGASMAMLGNTAFALSETPDTTVEDVIITKIDSYGCRFVDI